jgi:hypothetical protein
MARSPDRHPHRPPRGVHDDAVDAAIMKLCRQARVGTSVAPGDVARKLAGEDWHRALPAVKRRAARLADEGVIVILRKGKPVEPAQAKGVIRYALAPEA